MLTVPRRLALAMCLALASPSLLHAEAGEDGNVTISSGSHTLNAYTTLDAAVSANATSFTVTSAAALALPACAGGCAASGEINPTQVGGVGGFGTALAVGDLLMIYQPQELAGTATSTNDPTFGAVTDPGQAGLYEFAYVASVTGDSITIVTDGGGDPCTGLKNSYDAGAMVIRVPQLRNLTITGGSVVAPAWNGSTGGVVAMDVRPGVPQGGATLADWVAANGTVLLEVADAINVSGLGFRGGALDNLSGSGGGNVTTYRSGLCDAGGRKGEGILGWAGDNNTSCATSGVTSNNPLGTPYTGNTAAGGAFGRGAIANGGGGGNSHNAGGGGGANGGTLADWSGSGNPDATFTAQWLLEDDTDVASSQPLACTPPVAGSCTAARTSSGGGRGGYAYAAADQDADTVGPGAAGWAGNLRRNRGGLGGRPVDRGSDRFFFGGGGGAGDGNNGSAGAGGRGGGLVFLIAQRVYTGLAATTVVIRADGAAGSDTNNAHNDAAGGGGGGGSIVVKAKSLKGDFSVVGGSGGSQNTIAGQAQGTGGGGGGGVIATSGSVIGSPVYPRTGGTGGVSNSGFFDTTPDEDFDLNGATNGGTGELVDAPSASNAVFQCMVGDGGTFTTPAGHAYFHGRSAGNGTLTVDFVSTYELGNVGYYLEGERGDQVERASAMIPRTPGEAERSRSYSISVPDRGWDRLWLVEVDATGSTRRRGPFIPGTAEGMRPANHEYDWTPANSDHAQYLIDATRGGSDAAYLEVTQAGMQRVTFEQLQAAGVDLSGAPVGELAVIDRHGPVMRRVQGGPVFGPGSAIEFYGDPQPDLYKSTHTYLVERTVDASRVLNLPVKGRAEAEGAFLSQPSPAKAQSRHVPNGNLYDPVSPTDTPWYMYELYADASSPDSRSMSLSAPGAVGGAGTVHLDLSGFVDLPGTVQDHHVRVFLNNVLIADDRFDGIVGRKLEIPVSNVQANNTVRVDLPGDTGLDFDMIAIHALKLTYATNAQVSGGRYAGFGLGSVGERSDRFFADSFGDPDSSASAIPTEQQVVIAGRSATSRTFVIGPRSVTELEADANRAFNGSVAHSPASSFWVGDTAQMAAPTITPAPALASLPATAQWLAVSHGMFLDQASELAAHRSTQGLSTAVVAVEQLYRRYTAGNAHPDAIRRYLQDNAAGLQVQYLVLFGGANYNSNGLRGGGASTLSHLPTYYARTNRFVNFAPTDVFFGDLTGDQLLEFAVGRLPARTQVEADELVRKLIAYETQSATDRALLSSGSRDTNFAFSFMQAVDQFGGALPNAWDQTRVHVEALGTNPARTALLDAINQGRSVVTYTGHSSPINWDNSLFSVSDLSSLPANANQPIVMQFGCWTTFFVSPVVNTLGTAFVTTPNRGASSLFGSTVLLDQPNHDRFAGNLAPRLQSSRRLGDVIEESRRELALSEDPLQGSEVRLGITLLGDPASIIR